MARGGAPSAASVGPRAGHRLGMRGGGDLQIYDVTGADRMERECAGTAPASRVETV